MTNEVKNAINVIKEYLALDKDIEGNEYIDSLRVMVQALESYQWIPDSERLPEENIHVLCQFYMGGMAECYHAHNYWHIVGGYRIKIDEVIAWMPLPPSYQGG